MKRVEKPRYEWDPVQRAIGQAFMDRETETVTPTPNEKYADHLKTREEQFREHPNTDGLSDDKIMDMVNQGEELPLLMEVTGDHEHRSSKSRFYDENLPVRSLRSYMNNEHRPQRKSLGQILAERLRGDDD